MGRNMEPQGGKILCAVEELDKWCRVNQHQFWQHWESLGCRMTMRKLNTMQYSMTFTSQDFSGRKLAVIELSENTEYLWLFSEKRQPRETVWQDVPGIYMDHWLDVCVMGQQTKLNWRSQEFKEPFPENNRITIHHSSPINKTKGFQLKVCMLCMVNKVGIQLFIRQ